MLNRIYSIYGDIHAYVFTRHFSACIPLDERVSLIKKWSRGYNNQIRAGNPLYVYAAKDRMYFFKILTNQYREQLKFKDKSFLKAAVESARFMPIYITRSLGFEIYSLLNYVFIRRLKLTILTAVITTAGWLTYKAEFIYGLEFFQLSVLFFIIVILSAIGRRNEGQATLYEEEGAGMVNKLQIGI